MFCILDREAADPAGAGVNQDALGKQARIVRQSDTELVLAKPLEGASVAIGLFNLADEAREILRTAPGCLVLLAWEIPHQKETEYEASTEPFRSGA